jgi:hypothetical protein
MYSTKLLTPPSKGKVFFLAGTLVDQAMLHAVVEEGQFAQALGKNFVVKLDVPKISSSARKWTSVPRFSVSPRTLSGDTSTPFRISMTRSTACHGRIP